MSGISKVAIVVFAQWCIIGYGQTPVVLLADTPVPIRTVQSLSAAAQIGDYVGFQVTDPVWIGNVIAIPRAAMAMGEITAIHKSVFRQTLQLEIRLIYVRAASGERVPLRNSQADWKVPLMKGTLPIGTETTAYVGIDAVVNTVVTTETNRPGGLDTGQAELYRQPTYFNRK
jgi:hypothetical protein